MSELNNEYSNPVINRSLERLIERRNEINELKLRAFSGDDFRRKRAEGERRLREFKSGLIAKGLAVADPMKSYSIER